MVTDQFLNALPVWGGILKIGQEAKGRQVVLLPALLTALGMVI